MDELLTNAKEAITSMGRMELKFESRSQSAATKWFDRTFDFTFSSSLLPNICARLRGTPARLDDLLTGAEASALTDKPAGIWSIQEHVGHLLDIESLWRARVRDYRTGTGELTPTDLLNRKTDEANYNQRSLGPILQAFRSERLALVREVEAAPEIAFDRVILHPRMKVQMRLVDHLFFVAEHDDHHLATIWQLLNAAN